MAEHQDALLGDPLFPVIAAGAVTGENLRAVIRRTGTGLELVVSDERDSRNDQDLWIWEGVPSRRMIPVVT